MNTNDYANQVSFNSGSIIKYDILRMPYHSDMGKTINIKKLIFLVTKYSSNFQFTNILTFYVLREEITNS